jgi:endonuclease/exonuclease/phosphatase (EEP) superfamily protein YafD
VNGAFLFARPSRIGALAARGAARALAAMALVHPAATLLARWDWRADLLTHFPEPALVVTLVAAAAAVAARWRKPATGLVLLAAAQAIPLLRFQGPNPVPPASSSGRLKVLSANVFYKNGRYERLSRLIEAERPDVVGLIEYTDAWRVGLDRVRREFPYRLELPLGPEGIALWLRYRPKSFDRPRYLTPGGWPILHATLEFDGRELHVWLVHPASPLRRQGLPPGNPDLPELAALIRDEGGPQLVVGDLNCTDGSPFFHDFLRDAGLRDSRLGFGRQPSWPTGSSYRIPIDHALLSPDLAVVDRRLAPDVGSDHYPFVLEVAPAAGASATISPGIAANSASATAGSR